MLLFGPLRRILFFPAPSGPVESARFYSLFESQATESAKSSEQKKKKEQKALSVDMCQEYNTQLAGAKHAFLSGSEAKNRKA